MTDRRYRAPPPGGVSVVPLDEIVAVYHRASGQTHVVVSPAPEILDALAGAWLTMPELLDVLARDYDLRDPSPDALTARLEELVEAGLLEAA